MAEPQWWPVDTYQNVSGGWGADAAWYQKNVGLLGHNGIDFPGALGTPIYAVDDGVVFQAGWNIPWSGAAGGLAIIMRHAWGHSGYAHLSNTVVTVGQHFKRGDLIGYMGATGLALGVHLHYETLPLVPNFANGYSGRVNPAVIANFQPRGSGDPTRGFEMSTLYFVEEGGAEWALAGESPGTDANWLITRDQNLANKLAEVHGNAIKLGRASWNEWGAKYRQALKVSGGTGGGTVDQAAVNKAASDGAKAGTAEGLKNLVLKAQ